jgi:hypothetical protein
MKIKMFFYSKVRTQQRRTFMGGKDWGESGTNDGVMKELKEKSI